MYKMKKDGVVRIVATEAERKRWESLGYKADEEETAGAADGGQPDPLDSMDIDGLKKYAAERNIDIGNATSQNGILKKIREALAAASKED